MARPFKYGEMTISTPFKLPKSKKSEIVARIHKLLKEYEVKHN